MTTFLQQITDATTSTTGTGVFDSLMATVELHIKEQWKENRIQGKDYAAVYLAALQSVLEQSIKLVLSTDAAIQEVDKLTEEINLIKAQQALTYEQVQKENASTALLESQKDLIVQKIVTEVAQTVNPTGGLTKDQSDLFQQQIRGFKGKHLNEHLKVLLDSFGVIFAINDVPLTNGYPTFLQDSAAMQTLINAQVTEAGDVFDGF